MKVHQLPVHAQSASCFLAKLPLLLEQSWLYRARSRVSHQTLAWLQWYGKPTRRISIWCIPQAWLKARQGSSACQPWARVGLICTRLISVHCILGLLPLPTSSYDGGMACSGQVFYVLIHVPIHCTISLYQFSTNSCFLLRVYPNESYQFMFPPLSVPNESYKLIYQFSVLVSLHPALSIQRDGKCWLGLLRLPYAFNIARLKLILALHTWTTVSANLFLGDSDCMLWSSFHCSKELQVRH